MFWTGQKVVCVDASRKNMGLFADFIRWALGCDWPVEGAIYTIARPHVDVGELGVGVELIEIKNSWIVKRAFYQRRFRPLVNSKTDISVFTKMLTDTKVPALAHHHQAAKQ
jgi:hypothetical protein